MCGVQCVRRPARNVFLSVCQLQSQYEARLVSCRPVWMTAVCLRLCYFHSRPPPFRLIYLLLYKVIAFLFWNEPKDRELWWSSQRGRPSRALPCILNRFRLINTELVGLNQAVGWIITACLSLFWLNFHFRRHKWNEAWGNGKKGVICTSR